MTLAFTLFTQVYCLLPHYMQVFDQFQSHLRLWRKPQ